MSKFTTPFQLPIQKGTDLFPEAVVAPTLVRTVVVLQPDIPPGEHANIQAAVDRIMDRNRGMMMGFFRAMQQQQSLGIVDVQRNTRTFAYGTMQYTAQQGMTMLTVTIYPELFMTKSEDKPLTGGWDFFAVEVRWVNFEDSAADLDPRFRLFAPDLEDKPVPQSPTGATNDFMGFEMHYSELEETIWYGTDMTQAHENEETGESYGNESVYVDLRKTRDAAPTTIVEVRAHWYDLEFEQRAEAFAQELKIITKMYRGGEMTQEEKTVTPRPEHYTFKNEGFYEEREDEFGNVFCTENFDTSAATGFDSGQYPGQFLGYCVVNTQTGDVGWDTRER